MSMMSEFVKELREQNNNVYLKTADGKPTYPLKLILEAADVIEELGEKVYKANMERSERYYQSHIERRQTNDTNQ